MSIVRRYAFTVAVATATFVVLLGLRPLGVETIVAGYAIALAAIALGALTRAMAEATHDPLSAFEQELTRKRVPPTRPAELIRVSRELTLASSSAAHLHERLRPLLREIAEARLGIDVRRRPEAARDRVGPELWELIRADVPAPADRRAPGLPLRRIRDAVETLEQL
jgi:hypothetical protein